ncbi:hypothetical protein B0H13DRAFT_1867914 [Mycena leptocephala]|nr:hypothetical protein B0H13DRAFT_1867914 [Mycena leptocephala]
MSGRLGANVGGWQATSSKLDWVQNGQFVFVLGMGKMTPAFSRVHRRFTIYKCNSGCLDGPLRRVICVGCLAYDRAGTKGVMWGDERRGQMERVKRDIAHLSQRNMAWSDRATCEASEGALRRKGFNVGQNQKETGMKKATVRHSDKISAEAPLGKEIKRAESTQWGRQRDRQVWSWSKRDVETYKSVWAQTARRAGHRGRRVRATRAGNDGGQKQREHLDRKRDGDERREVTEKKPAWECSLSRKRPPHVRKQVGLSTQLGQKRRNVSNEVGTSARLGSATAAHSRHESPA